MADEPKVPEAKEPEQASRAPDGKPRMMVKVYAPFQVYFEGEATSVSAENATGPFDILPQHHNFLCMLVPSSLIIRTSEGGSKTIKVHRALLHVKADRLVVFMDV